MYVSKWKLVPVAGGDPVCYGDDNTVIFGGDWGNRAKYVWIENDEKNNEMILSNIKRQRNELLAASDWTQLPDAPLTESQKEAWRIYRQALRDLPEVCDPNNPVFPVPPNDER